jgi:hypothetical protein
MMLTWTGHGNGEMYFDGLLRSCRRAEADLGDPESSHIDGFATRPAEYEHRVVTFFDDALRSQP